MKSIKIWEFVVRVANPYWVDDSLKELTINENFLNTCVSFAVKNKIYPLFYEGCYRHSIPISKGMRMLAESYEKKRKMQFEEIKMLLELSRSYNLEVVFFKTFKPFNYIPDDVDILLLNDEDYRILTSELRKRGYFLLNRGTNEVIFRKIGKGAYVDLDIHRKPAVGHLDILNVKNLRQNNAIEIVKFADGYELLKFSEVYEVVREAAYSLLKDFNLSIPGFYLALNAIMKYSLNNIRDLAEKENVRLSLDLYLGVAYGLASNLFCSGDKWQSQNIRIGEGVISELLLKICKRRQLTLPYYYPVLAIAGAYLHKVGFEVLNNKNLKAIFQLIMQPSSKGIGILLDYGRGRFIEKFKL